MNARRQPGRWLLYTVIVLAVIIIVTMFMPDWQRNKLTEPNPAQPDSSDSGPVISKVRIRLDEPPNTSHAYIYAADMMGYFREEGLSLEIVEPSQRVNVLEQVVAGEMEIAIVPAPKVLFAMQRKLPIVSIAAVLRGPLTYLTVPHQSVVQTPRNLAGLKVALGTYPHYEAMLKTMVDKDGGDWSEVEIKSIDQPYTAVFRDVDAMIGPNVIDDRMVMEQQGVSVRMIEPTLYGVPTFYERVLAAGQPAVEENPELYRKVVAGPRGGARYLSPL